MRRIVLILLLSLLCTGCSTEKPIGVIDQEKEAKKTVQKELCYSVQIGSNELNFIATERLHLVSTTDDISMYELFSDYPVLSFDGKEVWFVDKVTEDMQYLNSFSFGSITAIASSDEIELVWLSDYLLSDATDVIKLPVTSAELNPDIVHDEYADIFPDYDSASVISYAIIQTDNIFAIVQQIDEGSTITYHYLGLEEHDCRVTMMNKLIIEDLDMVIDIEFQDNPNYKLTRP